MSVNVSSLRRGILQGATEPLDGSPGGPRHGAGGLREVIDRGRSQGEESTGGRISRRGEGVANKGGPGEATIPPAVGPDPAVNFNGCRPKRGDPIAELFRPSRPPSGRRQPKSPLLSGLPTAQPKRTRNIRPGGATPPRLVDQLKLFGIEARPSFGNRPQSFKSIHAKSLPRLSMNH
ncbi:hypothetical protein ACFY36_37205 [Actinoplanes sp. NPDC000266]